MFNFKTLKLTKRCDSESTNSFVGIRRNENGEVEFRLPHGFDDFPENDFEATKNLFFKMYRTFKKFERDNWRPNILDTRSAGKDQVQKEKDGYRFKNKEDNEVVLYSKIALIENLLEVYRDLALDQMERRIGADEKVDYSKIDRYLDRAIYLPKDVIYIDEMDLPRQTLRYESTTLIDLFCFIVCELQNELEEDIEPRVQELAHRFSEQHLSHEESLFNEETFETTIRTLKGVLDDIDKRTAYKDEDYWRLYDAIETFLYGELDMDNPHEDGTFWGISNFSSIWEDMCATWAFANFDILYADTNIVFNGKKVGNTCYGRYVTIYKKEDFDNPFFIEFGDNKERPKKRRWMRPDLIRDKEKSKLSEIIFEDVVKIIETKNYQRTLDFIVKPLSNDKTSECNSFCSNLKVIIKRKHIQGVRIIGDNVFKNFPRNELEIEKHTPAYKMASERTGEITLLDWKYIGIDYLVRNNEKIHNDVTKQLCYEFALCKVKPKNSIESQFVIPCFYSEKQKIKLEDEIGDFVDEKILYSRLRDNKIEIFKANFSKIQQVYLTHD